MQSNLGCNLLMDRIISEHINQVFTMNSPDAVCCHLKTFLLQLNKPTFDAMVILHKTTEDSFHTLYSNDAVFLSLRWSKCNLFNRLKMSGMLFLQQGAREMEFSFQSSEVIAKANQLTMFYHFIGNEEYIVFLTNSDDRAKSDFEAMPLNLIMRIALLRIIELQGNSKRIAHYQALFEQASSQIDLFFDLSSEWLWRTNGYHEFIHVDDYGRNTSIYTNIFIGETLWSLKSDDEAEHLKKWSQLMNLMDRNQEFINFEFETESGLWFSISGKPQFSEDEGFIGYLGIAKDITYNKEREHALREAKLKAERASTAKSQFLGLMSHEIRTPMNAILGVLELLKDTPLDEKQANWFSVIDGSAKLLKGLLNDILDYSKIETGQINLVEEAFDLIALVNSISKQFELTNTNTDITFETTIEPSCPRLAIGDSTRVGQIIFNILGNAFKFTNRGHVKFNVLYNEGNFVFTISDTGIGIEPTKIQTLLSEKQSDFTTNNRFNPTKGLGLGLSITKTLVRLMNGTLRCESIVDKQTTFSVSIPLLIQRDNLSPNSQINTIKPTPLSILVAEDNIPNQMLIRAFLEKAGHSCVIASTGAEALNSLRQGQFDLVLMDVMMPVMDGIEATETIRQKLKSTIPIWGLTANATTEDINQCIKVGMNQVLTKPISYHALINALQEAKILERAQSD